MTEQINDPDALLDIALEHHQAGRLSEAEALYKKILDLDATHPGALYLLGGIAYQDGRYQFAFELVSLVLADEENDPDAQHLLGLIAQRLGRSEIALAALNKAIAQNPHYAHAHHSLGNVLCSLQRLDAAIPHYDRAIALQNDFGEAYCSRGIALSLLGRFDAALNDFDSALMLQPDSAQLYVYRGNVLDDLRRYADAAQAYAQASSIDADCKFALGKKLHCELQICDWRCYADSVARLRTAVRAGQLVEVPFSFLAISPAADEQLQCARIYVADQYPKVADQYADGAGQTVGQPWRGESYNHDKIRIAYLSADFHNHATAYLMAELFERHDRQLFEWTALSFGPSSADAMRNRLQRAFDRFIDVRGESDAHIAALLREHEIDIAVDLKGLTGGSRAGIFARRAAPLQVSYLGYPGTMGADFIDYLIGDSIVTPPAHDACYAEKIVRLPDSYQVNDRHREIAAQIPRRADVGLPASGFVFCCFNDNYKITPAVFAIWMRLLAQVEGSVLWLFESNKTALRNLRGEALRCGIAPERLIAAPRLELPEHLARQRLADLFLDTLPVNAHTTASDALWVGLPVLTCLGDAFAGRVAASLLHALGLPELVTEQLADYEALALKLARTPDLLADLRAKLARNKTTQALFDTERFRTHIERAYTTMYERQRQGLAPAGFSVAPLPPL